MKNILLVAFLATSMFALGQQTKIKYHSAKVVVKGNNVTIRTTHTKKNVLYHSYVTYNTYRPTRERLVQQLQELYENIPIEIVKFHNLKLKPIKAVPTKVHTLV